MKPKIINVSCPKCSSPLLAFEQKKAGEYLLHSYGCAVEPTLPTSYAICKCGGRAAFDGNMLPR